MSTKIYAKARFGFREDTLENWITNNPVLEKGEPAVISDSEDSRWLKIGDGVSPFNALPWKFAGGGALVDKSYNPKSENAQSGIAVAEALSGVSGGNEIWENIADITLTEQAVINLTKDINENPISLKKFKILVELPAVTSATTIRLKLNNIFIIATQPSSATASGPSYGINAEHTFDWQFSFCVNNTNAYTNSQIYATPYGHRYAEKNTSFPCTSIVLALDNAFTVGLPSGAKIRIWGVKA